MLGPVLVAGALWALGRTTAAVVVLVLGAALALAGWASPRFDSFVARTLARFGELVGRVLAVVLLAPIALFVLVPVGVVLRALGWNVLDRGTGGRWQRRREDLTARRPYALEHRTHSPRTRLHGLAAGLGTTVVVAFLLLIAAWGVAEATGLGDERAQIAASRVLPWVDRPIAAAPTPGAGDPAQDDGGEPTQDDGDQEGDDTAIAAYNLLAHGDAPWAEDMFAETFHVSLSWDPLLTFRYGDREGEHVNLHDGVRAGYEADDADEDSLQVWFFGASTLFGIGQRDAHTIPSEVVRLAEDEGIPIVATNFGASAYVNWQSTQLLELELLEREPPDVVVFLAGVNELPAMMFDGRGTMLGTLFDAEIQARVADAGTAAEVLGPPVGVDTDPTPEEVAEAYLGPARTTEALAEGLGFEALHYLQPSLYTIELTDEEGPVLDFIQSERADLDRGQEQMAVVRAALADDVIDLGDALDEEQRPVLYDWAHTNEAGARATATAMYETLGPVLERLERARD